MINFYILPIILLGVLLNAGAQLLLKAGMNHIGSFAFKLSNFLPISLQVATNYYILTGLACYVISVAVWLMVLSRVEVSIAYPMVSLGYIVNAVAAWCLLNENISLTRFIGIIVILIGVFLIARN